MKRSLLSRLKTNGIYYIAGALLLLLGVPLYQTFILNPTGYTEALRTTETARLAVYLNWISTHLFPFVFYRILLILAFTALITLPFSLYRIIVAQEIIGRQELAEEGEEETDSEQEEEEEAEIEEPVADTVPPETPSALPATPWRGKGFAIIAVWAGSLGIVIYTVTALLGTIYLARISDNVTIKSTIPAAVETFSSLFTILSNTVGLGLLALSTLFFGAIIARAGMRLWPTLWVIFGYTAIAVAALLSGVAVAVASAPGQGQTPLTTPALLLFGLWILWLGIMLARLKPE